MSDEPVEIWGDGTTIRDFIYISDLISAILLSCTYSGKHRLFNVGSGTGLSLLDLTSKLEYLLNKSINVNFLEPRGCDVSTNVLSTDLALVSKLAT